MKKLVITSATALFFVIATVSPALAVTSRQLYRQEIQNTRQNLGQSLKEKIATREGSMKKVVGSRIVLGQAKIMEINGTSFTLSKDGKMYVVNTGKFDTCTTQFRRRFWGNSSLSELSVNDVVNVFGFWVDDAKTTVNACLVRDVSIQKRFGVFFGNIITINSSGFTMSTKSEMRVNQIVTVSSSTKLVNRKEQKMSLADLQIGNLIRVKGMWDTQANTVTEVREVKDFTLPIIPIPTHKTE